MRLYSKPVRLLRFYFIYLLMWPLYHLLFKFKQDDQEDVSPSLTEQQWNKKLPEPLTWRSDEEDEDSDFGEEQRDCYLKVTLSQD